MKNKTKYLLVSLLMLGFITASTQSILADDQTNYPPFVQALAEKLGVDENKVEDAFDEIRADNFAQRQQEREDQLSKAVEDGVITEEQKQAILDKQADNEFEPGQDPAQHHEEMQAWYEEQGIDEQALRPYLSGPRGGHRDDMGMGMGIGPGPRSGQTDSQ